jgi:hypothetical protein
MELKRPTWAGTSRTELLLKSRTLAESPQAHTSSGMAFQILNYKNRMSKSKAQEFTISLRDLIEGRIFIFANNNMRAENPRLNHDLKQAELKRILVKSLFNWAGALNISHFPTLSQFVDFYLFIYLFGTGYPEFCSD